MGRKRFIYQLARTTLYRIDRHECTYCGCDVLVTPVQGAKSATLDHGKSYRDNPELRRDPRNLLTCCHRCNSRKGAMTMRAWLQRMDKIGLDAGAARRRLRNARRRRASREAYLLDLCGIAA